MLTVDNSPVEQKLNASISICVVLILAPTLLYKMVMEAALT